MTEFIMRGDFEYEINVNRTGIRGGWKATVYRKDKNQQYAWVFATKVHQGQGAKVRAYLDAQSWLQNNTLCTD